MCVEQLLLAANGGAGDRYTRLDKDTERSNQTYIDNTSQQQQVSHLSLEQCRYQMPLSMFSAHCGSGNLPLSLKKRNNSYFS